MKKKCSHRCAWFGAPSRERAQREAATEGDTVDENEASLQVGWPRGRRPCFELLCSRACLELDQSHALSSLFAHVGVAQ